LRERWTELEGRLLGFVGSLTEDDLNRVMEYKTLKFGVYRNPVWQSMQHVVNHGTYHRGQGNNTFAAIGRRAGVDGLDALLPGTQRSGGRLARMDTIRTVAWIERAGAGGAAGATDHRAGADDGGAARGAPGAGGEGEAGMLAGVRFDFS